ncbi:hypothetical protein JTB14_016735 [Gonioctena quinquepunctata]|nr:hypothetical protein JTB14_016735 [Gonioctena quinquepunctata]
MVWGIWLGVRFFCGGYGRWLLFGNSFVHIFMFSYYLLTAIDKRLERQCDPEKVDNADSVDPVCFFHHDLWKNIGGSQLRISQVAFLDFRSTELLYAGAFWRFLFESICFC